MADSNAATVASAGAKSIIGGGGVATLIPIDPVTMVVGLIAGLWALLHTTPQEGQSSPSIRVFFGVGLGGFLAGVLAPVLAAGGINYLPWLSTVPAGPLQLAAAAILGAAPHLIPHAWKAYQEVKRGG